MKRSMIIAGATLLCVSAAHATFDGRDGQGPGSPAIVQPYHSGHASAQPPTFDLRSGQSPGSFGARPYIAGDAPANQDVSRGGRTGQGPAAQP
jgi:hypothetical protein